MAGILKGQAGSPIQFEVKPNVNGDDVATEQFALNNDLGVGQTWQNVTRAYNVTYTNNTNKPILVVIELSQNLNGVTTLVVDGITVAKYQGYTTGAQGWLFGVVPNNSTYFMGTSNPTGFSWKELR